ALPLHALAILHVHEHDDLAMVTFYRQRYQKRTLLVLIRDELLVSEPRLVTMMAHLGVSQFLPLSIQDEALATLVSFFLERDQARNDPKATTGKSASTSVIQLRQ